MLVLFWTSTIPIGGGRVLALPIGVPDGSLESFSERLTREGGLMVTKLVLERRDDGYCYILGEEALFIGLAATGTIRDHAWPVRREILEAA